MRIKDILDQPIDIDVCDNFDESCYMAFCGPVTLTEAGRDWWSDVLEYEITLHNDMIEIHTDNSFRTGRATKFFNSLAGYCSEKDWNTWFI